MVNSYIPMKKLVLSLLVIWTSEVNGQGYVVTTRNDTLRGEVKIMSFDEIDKVQVGEGIKKTQFKAIEVTVVSVGKDIYNPVLTQLGYRLLKLDHLGFLVSLYLARQAPSTTYDVQYLVKRTGKAFEVPNLKFRKQVSGFLSECASIEQKIEENKLGKNNLNEIIDEYNRCIENQTKAVFTTSSDPRLMAIAELRNKLQQNQSLAASSTSLRMVSRNFSMPWSNAAEIGSTFTFLILVLNCFRFFSATASSILLATTRRGFSSSAGS